MPTLIDSGTGDPRHLDAVRRALAGARLAQVLVTHGHSDHASGAASLAGQIPGVQFRKMPWHERDSRWGVAWVAVADGDEIDAGSTSLIALHTPGHAPDHLCFWHGGTRTVFCGDLAIQGTTVWIPSSLDGDLAAYLASLQRVIDLNPVRMFPAHGPVIENPATLLRQYIDHRREREEQILESLRQGHSTPDAIVARVYAGIKPSLIPLARDGVVAHLLKLERDARARRDGDAWHIIEA